MDLGECQVNPPLDFTQQIDAILLAVTRRIQDWKFPSSTYRVQLNKNCTFQQLMAYVPTLSEMGISHIYLAPFLEARPGSVHGYDIVNHSRINPEIGTLDDLRQLSKLLRSYKMGVIADVVPNHMSASSTHNAWWYDVLENGPASQFASYFDIDWTPRKADLAGKVLLPILDGQFGDVLENGELKLVYDRGVFKIYYFEHQLPLSPRSYSHILSLVLETFYGLESASNDLSESDHSELLSILTSIKNLPRRDEQVGERLIERRREKEIIKRRIHELVERSSFLRERIDQCVNRINGEVGNANSFDLLDGLLNDQAYRLSYWRVAVEEINYRRFFDINELAALRTELPEVFRDTHRLLFDLIDEGVIDGLRIDHPDGLLDPHQYFRQLQGDHFLRLCKQEHQRILDDEKGDQAVDNSLRVNLDWKKIAKRLHELWQVAADVPGSSLARPMFILVEKILGRHEQLPDDWTVHGTVGYEFLNAVNGLFIDQENERAMTSIYTRFTGEDAEFSELAYQCKRLVVRMSMASELNVLGHALDSLSERCRLTRDFTQSSLTRAIQEVIAAFEVYRSYIKSGSILERDRRFVELAIAKAIVRNPTMDSSIFAFLRDILLLKFKTGPNGEIHKGVERFAGRFQQLTGPIMAKSVEDTAFYRFNRMVSLNEVGGEPAVFGSSIEEFHEFQRSRSQKNSNAMSSSSTHDTKRSEDVRARLNVLSEIPRIWKERVQRWARWNKRLRSRVENGPMAPSRNAEYLLYQTIVGTLPELMENPQAWQRYCERLIRYMIKVEREAKVETSWVRPDEAYENALRDFIVGIFSLDHKKEFREDIQEFSRAVARHATWNSLSQLVLKIASPGIPDFYQGTEFRTLTLVDPDNRNSIDWIPRIRCMESIGSAVVSDLMPSINDRADGKLGVTLGNVANQRIATADLLKCYTTSMGLNFRKQFLDLFQLGSYEPIEVIGAKSRGLIAFARHYRNHTVIVVASRFSASLHGIENSAPIGDVWGDTQLVLPDSISCDRFQNIFTGSELVRCDERILVRELLKDFSIAIAYAVG